MPGERVLSRSFAELDAETAYAVWRLRQDVFIIEQDCPYPDLDGRDLEPDTRHVLLEVDGRLAGYVRILREPDGTARIGRVVLERSHRGQGLADVVMRAAVDEIGETPSVLAAQAPLAGWYSTFGYVVDGPEFLDDGIPHVPMRRQT